MLVIFTKLLIFFLYLRRSIYREEEGRKITFGHQEEARSNALREMRREEERGAGGSSTQLERCVAFKWFIIQVIGHNSQANRSAHSFTTRFSCTTSLSENTSCILTILLAIGYNILIVYNAGAIYVRKIIKIWFIAQLSFKSIYTRRRYEVLCFMRIQTLNALSNETICLEKPWNPARIHFDRD